MVANMLDKNVMRELGLNGMERQVNVKWFGGKHANESATIVNLSISGRESKQRHALKGVYGMANLDLPVQTLSQEEISAADLQRLPAKCYVNAEPKILIGLDHCHLGFPQENVPLNYRGPFAAKTSLGWVVYGPTIQLNQQPAEPLCLFAHVTSADQDLHAAVADYFEIENFGIRASPPVLSAEDNRANEILTATTKNKGNYYEVGLLWKNDDVILPESHTMALQRLVGIERKMKRL